jgi:hypothetical protein
MRALPTLSRWILVLCLGLFAGLPVAQEAAPGDSPSDPTPAAEGGDEPSTRPEETTVYVPYRRLAEVFEKEGRGVFLPYEEFLRLWKAAGDDPPVPPEPPVGHVVARADYQGEVGERVASMKVTMAVTTLGQGWIEVPVPLSGVAIRSVELGGSNAHVTTTPGGLRLLEIAFDAAVDTRPGEKRIELVGPRGAISRLDLRIPEGDLLVEVEPAVAESLESDDEGTRVLAFLADTGDGRIALSWEPRRAEAADVAGHRFAEVAAALALEEGLVRYGASIDLSLVQTETREIAFSLPEDFVVLGLEGPNLRDWVAEASEEEGRTRYTASLFEPARGRYKLRIRAERSLEPGAATLEVPDLLLDGVDREKGTIGIRSVPSFALAVGAREGLVQIAPGDLPESTRGGATLAFRYLRHPYSLELGLSRVEPRVTANVRSTLSLRADGVVEARAGVGLSIKKAGIFEVALDLPGGFDLREVGPDSVIDDYRIRDQEDGSRVLEITLANQTLGNLELVVLLETFRPDITGDLEVPLVGVRDVERESGVLGIAAESSLKVTTRTTTGLTPVDVRELPGSGVQQLRNQEPLLFGFRYHARPVAATIGVERKSAKVTASVYSRASVAGNAVRFQTTIDFDVQFSGVSTFTVAVPAEFGEDVAWEADGLRSARRAPGDEGEPDLWTITSQSPRLGGWRVTASYDRTLPDVQVGRRTAVVIPILVVRDVARQTGHIAVLKDENLEIRPEPSPELQAIDTVDLPDGGRGAFLAFHYLDPAVSLTVGVTRHEFEPVLPLVVEQLWTHSVIDAAGHGRHVSMLRLRNSSEQFLHIDLPEGVQPLTVTVDGKEAVLQHSDGLYLVQLPAGRARQGKGGAISSETLTVAIPYTDGPEPRGAFAASGRFTLEPPVFVGSDGQTAVPVLTQYYMLHLPDEFEYFEFGAGFDEWRRHGGVWEYLRGILRSLVPTLGGQRPRSPRHGFGSSVDDQLIEATGVSREILGRMKVFRFDRQQGGGELRVDYVGQTRFYLYCLAFLGLGLAAGTAMVRAWKLRRRHALVILFFVPMLLGPFFSPTGALLVGSFSLAAIALACAWLPTKVRAMAKEGQRRRASVGASAAAISGETPAVEPAAEASSAEESSAEESSAEGSSEGESDAGADSPKKPRRRRKKKDDGAEEA